MLLLERCAVLPLECYAVLPLEHCSRAFAGSGSFCGRGCVCLVSMLAAKMPNQVLPAREFPKHGSAA